MAYTYTQLIKAYAAVHGGIEPPPEVASELMLMTNPSYSDADRLNYILNSADQSTAVAVLSYQFFTGKSPTAEGIAYLVNSADNATDLNDPIYAKFNLENRFMNFATNLALNGQAKVDFDARYGSMDYAQYVASIYETIVGKSQAAAAGLDPDAIIQSIIGRQDLILLSARNNGVIGPNATQAEIDLALKAATAAYLLAEAIKADVGTYAAGTNNFMLAVAKGDAVYNTDITQTYAPSPTSGSSGKGQAVDNPPPATDLPGGAPPQPEPQEPQPPAQPQNFVLTPGTDRFTGNTRDDTFTGTHLTFNDGDQLDGGAGNDTLTVTVTGGALFTPPNNGVKNIETFTLNSDGAIDVNTYDWAGLKQVNATSVGAADLLIHEDTDLNATVTSQGGGEINIRRGHDVTVTATGATDGAIRVGSDFAISGDVVVSRVLTGNSAAGSITVNGGKTVSITQTVDAVPGQRQKNGGVVVTGSEATTTVTVKAAQTTADIDANVVTISDINGGGGVKLAGTITTASIDGYTTTTFTGTALTDLRLAHGGDAAIDNSSDGAPSATTLNLAVNGLTNAALSDANVYKTLNVTTGAQASTLSNVSFGKVEALAIAGDSRLTLTSASGLSALETVTISGAGGLSANLSGATVTSVSASGATGDNTLTLDGAKASFTGGSGVDAITVTAGAVSKALSLGGGDDILDLTRATSLTGLIDGGAGADTLKISVAAAASLKGQSSLISNVETIVLEGTGVADVGSALAGATGLATLTVTGAAGLTANLSGASATFVDAGGATGANTVTIDGSKTRFTGGAGVDAITVAAGAVSKAIALGDGDDILDLTHATSMTGALNGGAGDDTLKMTAALAVALISQSPSISSFEVLHLNAGAAANLGASLSTFGALKTVKITGSGALSADLSGLTTLTAVDASAGTGANTLTLDGAKASFTGGAGADVITVAAGAVSKAIALGGGDDTLDLTNATSLTAALDGGAGADTLKMTTTLAVALMSQVVSISNFETVQLTSPGDASRMMDLTDWAGVNAVSLAGPVNGNAFILLFNPTGADLEASLSNFGHSTFQASGGHDVTLNLTGVTGGDVVVGGRPTGAVTVTLDHAAGAFTGLINLTASEDISLTQTASNAVGTTAQLSNVAITGGAATTSVVIRNARPVTADSTHAGIAFSGSNSVTIRDINAQTNNPGVITSVDIDGYYGASIVANGLTKLKLAHGSSNVTVDGASGVVGAPTTLDLSLNDINGGTLSFTTSHRTLNLTTGASASTLDYIRGDLTALNLGGASLLTLASTSLLSSLQTVTVTGAAGISADLSGAAVTTIDASATTGDNTVKFDATKASYAGGSGVDRVTLTGDIIKSITLGDGDDFLDASSLAAGTGVGADGGSGTDTLRLNASFAATITQHFTNFERLELVGHGGGRMTPTWGGYPLITLSGVDNLTLMGLNSGDTAIVNGAGTFYGFQFSAPNGTLNLHFVDDSGAGVNFTSNRMDVVQVETINLTITDDRATPSGDFMNMLSMTGPSLKTLNIYGNAGLTLTTITNRALTTVDASGLTLGGFTWAVLSLNEAITVKGSATGTNTLDFTASSHGATYIGGTGADIITVGAGANTIDVGVDSSVDKVIITHATTTTDFTTINNLATGDQVRAPGAGAASPDPRLGGVMDVAPGAVMSTVASLANRSNGSDAVMAFLQVGSDTYVYVDRSDGGAYDPAADVLIKLTGVTLTSANYDGATGMITI